jgi:WD40 repeat protein
LKLDISRDRGTSVSSIAYSPDGKTLAIGQGSKVKLCDAQTGELKRTLNGQNWVESVAFSPDGKSVAGGGGKTVKLWKVD